MQVVAFLCDELGFTRSLYYDFDFDFGGLPFFVHGTRGVASLWFTPRFQYSGPRDESRVNHTLCHGTHTFRVGGSVLP